MDIKNNIQNRQNTIHDIFASYFVDTTTKILAHTVSKKLEDGHICIDLNSGEESEIFDIEKIKSSPYVASEQNNKILPFILHNDKIYLQRYFYYETNIIERIKGLISEGEINKKKYINDILKYKDYILALFELKYEEYLEKKLLIPWQLIATLVVLKNNFSIITGGPGTGKTTTIAKLLAILFKINPNISIALAAPTGKAAARLNESLLNVANDIKHLSGDIFNKFTELKAQTIHRLLGVRNESIEFAYNKNNPLKYDLIIIDESSMIDVAMMSKLLDAVPSKSRLVLLGDKDQLSSIEAGSIFGDLCKSQTQINNFSLSDVELFNDIIKNDNFKITYTPHQSNILSGSIVELQRSYRFKHSEGIGKFSNLVINGITEPELLIKPFEKCQNNTQCVKITSDYNSSDYFNMIGLYENYIKEGNISIALNHLENVKVLCAVKEGEYGVNHYNKSIENYLKSKGLLKPKAGFYNNQPIMITSNDYSLNLFNGDIGIVRLDTDKNQLRAYFQVEEKIISYPVSSINRYKTVFAMTIHKSQGSEFKNIVVILPKKQEHKLISRELLYTAVTRAKNNVLIISDENVLLSAVGQKTQRISGIKDRINNEEY